ncbi:MAG: hypothetical protein MUP47_09230, partial [Phycisphaerae bacterium]|nr:hypothetical protein [Phycisphaerae bacterium]
MRTFRTVIWMVIVLGVSTPTYAQWDRVWLWSSETGICDLGTLGQADLGPCDLNNKNQIVGHLTTPEGTQQGFVYEGGGLQFLGIGLRADGINDAGQIVGGAINTTIGTPWLWDPSTGMHQLPDLGGHKGIARDINSSGQITGASLLSSGKERACLWDRDGTVHDLGCLDSYYNHAIGINDSAQVVGVSGTDNWSICFPFIWDHNDPNGMRELGNYDYQWRNEAFDINNLGQSVGYFGVGGEAHACLWETPTSPPLDLGTLGGVESTGHANGINENAQVVGWVGDEWEVHARAFIWDSASGMSQIPAPDPPAGYYYRYWPDAINDNGVVLLHGILAPIPEPGMLSLLALGGLALLRRK